MSFETFTLDPVELKSKEFQEIMSYYAMNQFHWFYYSEIIRPIQILVSNEYNS